MGLLYQRGIKRGRQIAQKLEQRGTLNFNAALSEEMDSRQDAFEEPFVTAINQQENAKKLWSEYEQGVEQGIRQILSP